MNNYQATIGLETHIMQKTNAKMFCHCKNEYGALPNIHICPVCMGYPGALPVINKKAVELCCKAGLLLGCKINSISRWDRKNYFYPDMAKNYQITQNDYPLCLNGQIEVEVNSVKKIFKIERIHQEENAAKNTHSSNYSSIDYNRAGTALMEIVSTPCMHSVDDVLMYMNSIKEILQFGEISNCDQEKGQMRSDVNISVNKIDEVDLGSKVEIKNMNSFSFIADAITYEVNRQIEVLESGGVINQETRGYDSDRGITFVQRTKEDAHDYRYFPEPDLLPLKINTKEIEKWKSELPELPKQRRLRYIKDFKLPKYDAEILTSDREISDWFENSIKLTSNYKAASNFIMGDIMHLISENNISINNSNLTPELFVKIINLIDLNKISINSGRELIKIIFKNGGNPDKIIEDHGMIQVSDDSSLELWVNDAIADNPKPVSEYKKGNLSSINFLMGQVMRASKGKANPSAVMKLLKQKLG